ncbi:hypothetical protein [Vibrio parahaemolyticus]|uniref:hypothetical protein n=1 Tax=Vibrio parahaemolyticus TaxID=670 RepID=UPI00226B3B92|nr:hypothetical protein [Vibrio parahaemolyticus]MCX8914775.1 hypothetical protein [Vibrio parahaemolyticus]
MKSHLMPEVTLDSIEKVTTVVSGGELSIDVEFGSTNDYVAAFEEMAEKISDETLIDILKKRDPEYIAEEHR